MDTRNYQKGDIIFRQGDTAESMFEILWGTVGIYADYGTPKEKKLAELGGGESAFFGEMGLIDRAPRSATAVVLENRTKLREITEASLGSLFQENPGKVLHIIQHLSRRLRRLTNDYMEVCKTAAYAERAQELSEEEARELDARAEHYAKAAPLPYDAAL